MDYQRIRIEREGDAATITLDHPEKRNALSLEMMSELLTAFGEVGESKARGVLLAAVGPVFSIQSIPQPVVARVQGLATAAGCQLVASCDLVVASEDAAFATPGGKGGWFCITPMVAVTRAVGRKRALELLLTGDAIDAKTAAEWGLVNRVVPPAELDTAARELLRRATRGSPAAKAIGKQAFYTQVDLEQDKAYAYALELMAASSLLPDAQEQMRAFLEKRLPVFENR
jgi:enoyl-CoA hydratase/carnithine racemase